MLYPFTFREVKFFPAQPVGTLRSDWINLREQRTKHALMTAKAPRCGTHPPERLVRLADAGFTLR